MAAKGLLLCAAVYGFMAVALGAFGAHALKARLDDYARGIWSTAVDYHLAHALALFLVAILARQTPSPLLTAAGSSFALGILVFSGSLYALALSGVRALGAVTPLGGLLLLAGWLLLAVYALRS